jgi:homogentisate 1,2-dioxygenase
MNQDLRYQAGFGNTFSTEALQGALPVGKNSPLHMPYGLYAEQLSGSAFTMKRGENLRSWLYRKQPSVVQKPFEIFEQKYWSGVIADEGQTPPQALRWLPLEPKKDSNFIESLRTMVANAEKDGSAVHHYAFNQSMKDQFFYNADGEMMIIPQQGSILAKTEFGHLKAEPQEILVIPRGVKFQIEGVGLGETGSPKSASKLWYQGYVGENLGEPFRLPDLGPIGSNGLAAARDFLYPVAAFDQVTTGSVQVVCKFQNVFWQTELDHSPLDVVAWYGNYAPYKYDLRKFNTMGTVSFDHPDPSIYTVLTSPSPVSGKANVDFVIFPPRWLVGEDTFRPPYFHRNIMSEYMGLICGEYDAKKGGFVTGGSSLHNAFVPHGPDATTFYKELERDEKPVKVDGTMAFMFESSRIYQVSAFALKEALLDKDYWKCWQGLKSNFKKEI